MQAKGPKDLHWVKGCDFTPLIELISPWEDTENGFNTLYPWGDSKPGLRREGRALYPQEYWLLLGVYKVAEPRVLADKKQIQAWFEIKTHDPRILTNELHNQLDIKRNLQTKLQRSKSIVMIILKIKNISAAQNISAAWGVCSADLNNISKISRFDSLS